MPKKYPKIGKRETPQETLRLIEKTFENINKKTDTKKRARA